MRKLFGRYEEAKDQGEKLSLEELGEGIMHSTSAGEVLRRVDLPNLNYNSERCVTPKDKKKALRRAIEVEKWNIREDD